MPLGVLIALTLVALVAMVLGIVGIRGRRVDFHPLCCKCGFDLVAHPADSPHCPECGGDARDVRIGHRRRRWRLIGVASLLLVPSMLILGIGLWHTLHRADLDPYKPVWMLLRETHQKGNNTALAELLHRMNTGRLSDAQLLTLADECLARQGRAGPFDKQWYGFFDGALNKKLIDEPRMQQYWNGVFSVSLWVRPRVSRAKPEVILAPRVYCRRDMAPGGSGIQWHLRIEKLNVAGDAATDPRYHVQADGMGGRSSSGGDAIHHPLSPTALARPNGAYTVTADIVIEVFDAGKAAPIVLRFPKSDSFDLLPASEPAMPLERDPAKAAAMTRAWTHRVTWDKDDRYRLNSSSQQLPVASLRARIFLRSGDREWEASTLESTKWGMGRDGGMTCPGLTADKVDVIFRPDPEAAMDNPNIDRIWGDELIWRDIPIDRSGRR